MKIKFEDYSRDMRLTYANVGHLFIECEDESIIRLSMDQNGDIMVDSPNREMVSVLSVEKEWRGDFSLRAINKPSLIKEDNTNNEDWHTQELNTFL